MTGDSTKAKKWLLSLCVLGLLIWYAIDHPLKFSSPSWFTTAMWCGVPLLLLLVLFVTLQVKDKKTIFIYKEWWLRKKTGDADAGKPKPESKKDRGKLLAVWIVRLVVVVFVWFIVFSCYGFYVSYVKSRPAQASNAPPRVPSNAEIFYITTEEQLVKHASTGKHWHLEVPDSEAKLEFRAYNLRSDGTKEFLPSWTTGGIVGVRNDFPYAEEYLVKVLNRNQTKTFWFEY